MANTIVTDSYKFANVTNVSTGMDSGFKKVSDEMDFTQMLGNAAKDSVKINSADTVSSTQTVVEKNSKSNLTDSTAKANDNDISKSEKVASLVNEKCKEIKDKIKDELDVSDDEFDNAMETLGLSMQDLLDPNKVKDLMMNLSGETDSLSILTNADLYDSMKNVFNLVTESNESITNEFNLSSDELNAMLTDEQLFADMLAKAQVQNDFSEGAMNDLTAGLEDATEEPLTPTVDLTINNDGNQSDVAVDAANELTSEQMEALVGNESQASDFSEASNNTTQNFAKSRTDANSNVSVEVTKDTQTKPVMDVKGDDNASKESLFGNESSGTNAFATNVTTTVNTVGDVVEEIRTYTTSQGASEIIDQVTQQIRVNISADTTSMEMQLHPASLGTVNMQISSVNGTVTAHLTVQNEAVKAALESQLITLTQTFEEQGQKVEAVEVSVANYDLNRQMSNQGDKENSQDAFRNSKTSRKIRNINLSELGDEEIANLDAEDKVSAEVMKANGTTVDFMA